LTAPLMILHTKYFAFSCPLFYLLSASSVTFSRIPIPGPTPRHKPHVATFCAPVSLPQRDLLTYLVERCHSLRFMPAIPPKTSSYRLLGSSFFAYLSHTQFRFVNLVPPSETSPFSVLPFSLAASSIIVFGIFSRSRCRVEDLVLPFETWSFLTFPFSLPPSSG